MTDGQITIPKWFITIVALIIPLIASLWGGAVWVYGRVDSKIHINEESIEAIEVNQAVQNVKLDFVVDGISALSKEHLPDPVAPPLPSVYESAVDETMMIQESRKE